MDNYSLQQHNSKLVSWLLRCLFPAYIMANILFRLIKNRRRVFLSFFISFIKIADSSIFWGEQKSFSTKNNTGIQNIKY